MFYRDEIKLKTKGQHDSHDLTPLVQGVIEKSKLMDGLVHVFNIGSTGAIGTIEFEDGLRNDLPEALKDLIPPSDEYAHQKAWNDGNAHSHLHASILGPEITVPFRKGELTLGKWQQIFHLECDIRPHDRVIVVTIIGA